MTSHLDPGTLYALLDGELDPVAERTARIHLWRCGRCRALRDECAAVRSALAWYGAAPTAPPPGYWPGFWARWEARAAGAPETVRPEPRRGPRTIGALAAAAAVALALIGGWWAVGRGPTPDAPAPRVVAEAPAGAAPVGGADWRGDYELFERARAAVGSMDPLSKGILLAGLADSP